MALIKPNDDGSYDLPEGGGEVLDSVPPYQPAPAAPPAEAPPAAPAQEPAPGAPQTT